MKNATFLLSLLITAAVLYVGVWQWGFSRRYVEADELLLITSKFGAANPNPDVDRVVDAGIKGVRRDVLGEGRHFYNPVKYTTETKPVVVIGPNSIGVVESKSGKALPQGEYLAEDGFKGILRAPLTPGKWRLNPFAYEVTQMPAVRIRPGFVGCVTSLAGTYAPEGQLAEEGQRGVRKDVLQPGIYYINPRAYKIDEVEVGYSQITMKDVAFPSKDGFDIRLDISVVWGLSPESVPTIIDNYGNVNEVIEKVIFPQVMSICRIEGSKYGAREFIEGESREQFQNAFTQQLERESTKRHIDILIGLVRDITVPSEVRDPIRLSKIAVEEQLTKEQQTVTQVELNTLEELRADVEKGVREVAAETEKLVAEIRATGERTVASINAQREVDVAEIMRQVAEIQAQRQRLLGKADADVTELLRRAEADRFT